MLLNELKVSNLLSFGPGGMALPLRPLNVLIGPNGSGKSNLIEVISLLQSAPRHLAAPVRESSGIAEWLYKGERRPTARVEVLVNNPIGQMALRHVLAFTQAANRFDLVDERIENETSFDGHADVYFYYRFQNNRPVLNVKGEQRFLQREDIDPEKSILSQRKDPDQYPEITYLGEQFEMIRIYREWTFGRYTIPRQPQKADDRNDLLAEDCRNLGLVLNRLRRDGQVKRAILEGLKQLYDGIEDFDISIEGGTVQVFLQESGFTIPATRLSDGTLRYLCLLTLLCDPSPPPLICIEEPELGLHPDLLPTLADLLVEASGRTQIIVTTHSDILVDAMTEQPENVVVFEKHDGQTRAERLDTQKLSVWLEKYRLGDLWTRGELGGTRW